MTVSTYVPGEIAEPVPNGAPPWVARIEPAVRLASIVANTDFVPRNLRGREEAVAACIMYGQEIGIGPMQALRSIDIIEGRPQPSAELMRALVLQAGHELWTEEASGTRVVVSGRRRDSSKVVSVVWTSDMATKADLTNKTNWKRYPRAMLAARAYAELCRLHFPDAVRGLVTDEPSEVEVDAEAAVAVEPEAPKTVQRKPRKAVERATEASMRKPAEPAPEPEKAPEPGPATAGFGPSRPAERVVTAEETRAAHAEAYEVASARIAARAAGITDPQHAKMNATLGEIGVTSRAHKLQIVAALLDREIASSKDMSKAEASTVIEALAEIAAGDRPLPVVDDP